MLITSEAIPNILTLCSDVVFPIVENRYAHLLPKDEEVFEDYNTYSAKRFEEVQFKLSSSF